MHEIQIGKVVGTGAALTVPLGFVPDHVRVTNVTDGGVVDEHYTGASAAGTSVTMTGAAVSTRAAPNGITPFAGDINTPAGFTIGAGMSENGKTLAYVATRNK